MSDPTSALYPHLIKHRHGFVMWVVDDKPPVFFPIQAQFLAVFMSNSEPTHRPDIPFGTVVVAALIVNNVCRHRAIRLNAVFDPFTPRSIEAEVSTLVLRNGDDGHYFSPEVVDVSASLDSRRAFFVASAFAAAAAPEGPIFSNLQRNASIGS